MNPWEQHKVTACQVEQRGGWYVMFYIGFENEPTARIGLARSRNGLTAWQRHPGNPIIFPGREQWDHDACYKPYALFDGAKWLLWYNGRHGSLEQVGVAPPEWTKLRQAQSSAAARPEFAGNVGFVPTHDFVRKPEDSPNPGHGHHEFGNAETSATWSDKPDARRNPTDHDHHQPVGPISFGLGHRLVLGSAR